MEGSRLFILFLILSSLTINVKAFIRADEIDEMIDEDDDDDSSNFDEFAIPDFEGSKSLVRLSGRSLAQQIPANSTCNIYPRICRRIGSAGPDCCRKKCVNVRTDSLNCFKCGHKCKNGEICCKGRCKNILKDKKNCGGCNIKCKPGDRCDYGMCNYA